MIPYSIITSFLTTVFVLFFEQSMLQTWNNIDQTEKNEHLRNIQSFFRSAGKELNKDKGKRRMKEPDDYEGDPETVNAWCRYMTMYFQSNNIFSNWEWIEITLGKIKKGKRQLCSTMGWWKDHQICLFSEEVERIRDRRWQRSWIKEHDPQISIWLLERHDSSYRNISTETQTPAIEEIHQLCQGSRMVEDYWSDFCTWKELTGYNKVALVGIFKKGLYPGLAWKLVELGQLKNSNLLESWYKMALDYERARQEANIEFGSRNKWSEKQVIKKEEKNKWPLFMPTTLLAHRRDPNTMDIDSMCKQGICFNCSIKGHITAKYPEPRKERKFFGRKLDLEKSVDDLTVDEMQELIRSQVEGFGKGRE